MKFSKFFPVSAGSGSHFRSSSWVVLGLVLVWSWSGLGSGLGQGKMPRDTPQTVSDSDKVGGRESRGEQGEEGEEEEQIVTEDCGQR